MSYILDALKKADAERERNRVPGLHAQAAADAADEARRIPGTWWRRALVAALVGLVALAAWWWSMRPATPESPAPLATNAPAVVVSGPAQPPAMSVVVPQPVAVPPPAPAPRTQHEAPPKIFVPPPPAIMAPVVAAPAMAATTASAVDGRIPQLAELNADLRRQLPALTVGGSVYSATPASRMVILNGQVLREGDSVIEGLVVERIGLKGSILSLRGTRFEIKH